MKIDPSKPVAAQVHHILRLAIVKGTLRPGQKLSEAELAKEYEISRQPIREAFIKLAKEQLLEIRPQRGTFVPKVSINHVQQSMFIREAIEVEVVRIAVIQIDSTGKQALRHEIALQQQCDAQDVEYFLQLDDQFHACLASCIARGRAWDAVETYKAQLDRVRFLSFDRTPVRILVQQHEAIVNAICNGDSVRAEECLRRHLHNLDEDLPQVAALHAEYFTE